MSQHFLQKGDKLVSLDHIHATLVDALQQIASDFDLAFNIWRPRGNTVGRLYLNFPDRSAVAWIEENNSKRWIRNGIDDNLRALIEEAFDIYCEDYNEFYRTMDGYYGMEA